jgi:hypothetical protein
LREGIERLIPDDIDMWLETADAAREQWKRVGIPMEQRRPLLLAAINALYTERAVNANGTVEARS